MTLVSRYSRLFRVDYIEPAFLARSCLGERGGVGKKIDDYLSPERRSKGKKVREAGNHSRSGTNGTLSLSCLTPLWLAHVTSISLSSLLRVPPHAAAYR